MSAILTLFHNTKTNQLALTTDQFNIGNQYSNNAIRLTLNRNDLYTQYIPYLIIQPEYSKPFSPIQFTSEIILSNIFTQTTYLDVQVVLKKNTDAVYSSVIRLNLIPALPDNSPLDVTGIYNRPVSVTRASRIITKLDLRIEDTLPEINYDDIIQPLSFPEDVIPPYVEPPKVTETNKDTSSKENESSTTDPVDDNASGNVPDSDTSKGDGETVETPPDTEQKKDETGDVTGDSTTNISGDNTSNNDSTNDPVNDTVDTPPADTESSPKEDIDNQPADEKPSVPIVPLKPARYNFDLLLNTPFYTMNSNHLLVFLNGRLLTQPEYFEIGNGISNMITIQSLILNPEDKIEFVSFG